MITIGNKNFFWEPGTCFRYSLFLVPSQTSVTKKELRHALNQGYEATTVKKNVKFRWDARDVVSRIIGCVLLIKKKNPLSLRGIFFYNTYSSCLLSTASTSTVFEGRSLL